MVKRNGSIRGLVCNRLMIFFYFTFINSRIDHLKHESPLGLKRGAFGALVGDVSHALGEVWS